MNELTRKGLEGVAKNMSRQLTAERIKCDVTKQKIKEIIEICGNNFEISGKLRALLVWLDGNSQFQFQKETERDKRKFYITYPNIYCLIFGAGLGMILVNFIRISSFVWGN